MLLARCKMADVPYKWIGTPSKAWASIGALVSSNIVGNILQVSALDFERSMWLELTCVNKDGSLNTLFCCGFYCAPGGISRLGLEFARK